MRTQLPVPTFFHFSQNRQDVKKLNAPLYFRLLFILLSLLALTACSDEEAEGNDATPELAVVVFATEDPNAPTITPIPTSTRQATATSTSGPSSQLQPAATSSRTVSVPAPTAIGSGINDSRSTMVTIGDIATNRPENVNPLTGLVVDDPVTIQRRPIMVRVGNDPGARPQVALNDADIVYEEIVEWWVTRFTAIYLANAPEMIAPIRSARLINLQLVPQFQGALANSGGSDGVRWLLSQTDIVNLDEFFVPRPYFYRPNEGWQTRLAFDAQAARSYMAEEGLDNDTNLRGFYFSDMLDLQSLPDNVTNKAERIVIPFPQRTSETVWNYDETSGKYLRTTAGVPHLDFNGEQLAASNVIIYFADHQETDIVEDSNGATSIRIIINGKGAAWLLRNGQVLTGNWEAEETFTPNFIFDSGQLMPLKPGNTFVQVVPLAAEIDIDGTLYNSLTAAASPGSRTGSDD